MDVTHLFFPDAGFLKQESTGSTLFKAIFYCYERKEPNLNAFSKKTNKIIPTTSRHLICLVICKDFLAKFCLPPGDNEIIAARQLSSAAQTPISLQHATVQMILQTFDVFLTIKKS